MICVIATIETIPGGRAKLLNIFKELVPKVLTEKGCLEYEAMVDLPTKLTADAPPRENVVTMVEKWADLESLEAHLNTPHMQEFRKATESLRLQLKLQILAPGLAP